MGLFDKFKSSPTAPKGYAPVKVEFTEEEARAIGHALRRYSEIFNADAPEGTEAIVTHKMHDAMKANGLVEYVEDLMLQLQDVPEADYPEIIDKAIRARCTTCPCICTRLLECSSCLVMTLRQENFSPSFSKRKTAFRLTTLT